MATCFYCGKPVGFLRRSHKQCRELHKTGATRIPEFFVKALKSPMEPETFHALAKEVASTHFVREAEFRQLAVRGLTATIDEALKRHSLSEHDDKRITGLCKAFGVAANELGPAGMRFAKAEVLRNLDEKRLPSKTQVEKMPINLEHNESIIWLFNQVSYHTTRQRTHRGIFVIASHNVYFWSWKKAMKIPVKKINSVVPYSDRLQIVRDGANPAPYTFKLDDPTFVADVIARLKQC